MIKLRSFLISAFIVLAVAASAQVSFGVKAGLNLSTITDTPDSKTKVGYKVGPTMEYAFYENMAIQTGLFLSSKGVKTDHDYKVNANYLELPVSFAYKYPVAFDTNIYANIGPYFAYGIFGKSKTTTGTVIDDYTEVDTFDNTLKYFDMGLTFGLGMEVTQFNFGVNYDLGLLKVKQMGDGKNGNFWISVVYSF